MKIQRIKIKNLFEIFNYDIDFINENNIRIITGPNGFGKTMILNIIFNLFNKRFSFFQKLVFEEIELYLSNDIDIKITKNISKNDLKVVFDFFQNSKKLDSLSYSEFDYEKKIIDFLPLRKISKDTWQDRRSGIILNIDDIFDKYSEQI